MQKAKRTFNPQSGRILPDLSKVKKMADIENGQTEAAKVTKTKGDRIIMMFLTEKGEPAKAPQEGCRAIQANFVKTGETDQLDLRLMVNEDGTPADMLFRLAAFGAATLGRNEVNTTSEEDGDEAAAGNCKSRWEGFRRNSYRSISIGSATPIILLALERALRDANLPQETIDAKVSGYRAAYDGAGLDDKALAKARREVTKKLMGAPEVRAAEKAIREERAAARAASAPQIGLGDL